MPPGNALSKAHWPIKVAPITPFALSCPTKVLFGAGVRAQLPEVLPAGCRRVALVRGGRDAAVQWLVDQLGNLGIDVVQARCVGEPDVAMINRAVDAVRAAALAGPETPAGTPAGTPNGTPHGAPKVIGTPTGTPTGTATPTLIGAAKGRVGVAGRDPGQIEAVIACGGGAVMDAGKAIAFCLAQDIRLTDRFDQLDPKLLAQPSTIPCIALPTTAGTGAEVTANAVLGIPSRRAKISLRGPSISPMVALVDPDLMRDAPLPIVLASGLDAVVQVIESYTSNAATPFSDGLTRPNILLGLRALKQVVEDRSEPRHDAAVGAIEDAGHGFADMLASDAAKGTVETDTAWSHLAWVSLASGMALANSGLGAAHGLASVIGGRCAAPHGAICGRFIAPVLRRNQHVAAQGSLAQVRLNECIQWIASVFPPLDPMRPLGGFEAWITDHGLPGLADLGVVGNDFDAIATQSATASSSRKNAVALTRDDFVAILRDA